MITTIKKHIKLLLLSLFIIASLSAWLAIKTYDSYYISTDDAYLNANIVQISPRVSGQIVNTLVHDNQHVQKNQELFDIDPEPFKLAVARQKAQLAMNEAALANANIKAKRTIKLANKQFVSAQNRDDVTTNLKTSRAAVALAKANLDQANLNLSWSAIKAPDSGWVTNMHLRNGELVASGQPLFALISDKEFWVDANFKETKLEKIKQGQLATIKIDMYPGTSFTGVVESISAGTGASFSLLPPQNATANWVKVTQRVTVRIRVINPDINFPLRIGTSASVTIRLKEFYTEKSFV